jgi:two-component system, chemotaxis family, protein-glutamate methylesterase/glutaminase
VPRDLVVIGASAGGIETLREIAGGLSPDLPASVLVVVHLPPQSPGLIPRILSRSGPMPARHATDGEELQPGRIYVAPADFHMLVDERCIRLARGPRENLHRPAVDPLFRSAAVAYGPRAIGVVLSGALDDGTAGLSALKRCGGIAVVQDPEDALYASMPRSALRNVRVDHVVPRAAMAALLDRLTREEPVAMPRDLRPRDIALEAGMAAMDSNEQVLDQLGKRSTFTCPECHGTLWEMNEQGALRYRCHVGHAYTGETLLSLQSDGLEDALWAAVRSFEENATLSERMAERSRSLSHEDVAERFTRRAETARRRAQEIRALIDRTDVLAETAG